MVRSTTRWICRGCRGDSLGLRQSVTEPVGGRVAAWAATQLRSGPMAQMLRAGHPANGTVAFGRKRPPAIKRIKPTSAPASQTCLCARGSSAGPLGGRFS